MKNLNFTRFNLMLHTSMDGLVSKKIVKLDAFMQILLPWVDWPAKILKFACPLKSLWSKHFFGGEN